MVHRNRYQKWTKQSVLRHTSSYNEVLWSCIVHSSKFFTFAQVINQKFKIAQTDFQMIEFFYQFLLGHISENFGIITRNRCTFTCGSFIVLSWTAWKHFMGVLGVFFVPIVFAKIKACVLWGFSGNEGIEKVIFSFKALKYWKWVLNFKRSHCKVFYFPSSMVRLKLLSSCVTLHSSFIFLLNLWTNWFSSEKSLATTLRRQVIIPPDLKKFRIWFSLVVNLNGFDFSIDFIWVFADCFIPVSDCIQFEKCIMGFQFHPLARYWIRRAR